MPQKSETFLAPRYGKEALLQLSYAVFLQAGWVPKYAGTERLIGFTKVTWGTPHETVTAEVADGSVTVTSKLPDTASWDVLNKNKKNLATFSAAFETVKAGAPPDKMEGWKQEVEALQQSTVAVVEQAAKDSEEVEKVMNLSGGSKTITYSIMGLNMLLFALMVINGVSAFEPTNHDLLNWGANFKLFTVNEGQWWRLVTNTFLHIGFMHLLFNMYALYVVGVYLEPLLGKARYGVAYLCTGVLASLTSLWYHGDAVISAGASGAIFGMYGVFLALLTTSLIPKLMRKALLQSIAIFVGYNLVFGLKSGVDNSAHLGGLISGFVIGYIYYPTLKSPETQKAYTVAGAVLTGTVIFLGILISRS